MNGILCIDKPPDFTSFDVVAKSRGILGTRKIGHGGTLDPMATGVLPLFVGRATKACDMLPVQDKRYRAVLRLGVTTDSQDSTGRVLSAAPVTAGRREVEEALGSFTGPIEQVPPMYSAIKIGGKRLYDLARQGLEVERPPRPVTIHSLSLAEADEAAGLYTLDVFCSKGTYIRTLCHDLGQLLGCGAVMTALRRTEACGFSIESCITLEEAQSLREQGLLEERLLPVEAAFAGLPRVSLDRGLARLFANGIRLELGRLECPLPAETGRTAVYGPGGFLAIAKADRERGLLVSEKWFGPPERE